MDNTPIQYYDMYKYDYESLRYSNQTMYQIACHYKETHQTPYIIRFCDKLSEETSSSNVIDWCSLDIAQFMVNCFNMHFNDWVDSDIEAEMIRREFMNFVFYLSACIPYFGYIISNLWEHPYFGITHETLKGGHIGRFRIGRFEAIIDKFLSSSQNSSMHEFEYFLRVYKANKTLDENFCDDLYSYIKTMWKLYEHIWWKHPIDDIEHSEFRSYLTSMINCQSLRGYLALNMALLTIDESHNDHTIRMLVKQENGKFHHDQRVHFEVVKQCYDNEMLYFEFFPSLETLEIVEEPFQIYQNVVDYMKSILLTPTSTNDSFLTQESIKDYLKKSDVRLNHQHNRLKYIPNGIVEMSKSYVAFVVNYINQIKGVMGYHAVIMKLNIVGSLLKPIIQTATLYEQYVKPVHFAFGQPHSQHGQITLHIMSNWFPSVKKLHNLLHVFIPYYSLVLKYYFINILCKESGLVPIEIVSKILYLINDVIHVDIDKLTPF